MRRLPYLVAPALLVLPLACSGTVPSLDDAGADAGNVGEKDAGFDAGEPVNDAGFDAGVEDAGVADAGVDAGQQDAGIPDAGSIDAGVDAGCPDAGMVCSGACVDVQSDPLHCGDCSTVCTDLTMVCRAGHCDCPAPLTACSGLCVDTQSDRDNCGMCGTTCSPLEGRTCGGGQCVCRHANETYCGGACTDTKLDPKNCGACGAVCPAHSTCVMGGCACDPSYTGCADTDGGLLCSTLLADLSNCGSCGAVCSGQCLTGHCFSVMAYGQKGPWGLTHDATTLYWSNAGSYTTAVDGTVASMPLAGGPSVTVATSQALPTFIQASRGQLYWMNCGINCSGAGGGVNRAKPDGGGVQLVATTASTGLAVDDNYYYWTEDSNGLVRRAPLDGGPAVNLATGQGWPWALALTRNELFWSNNGGGQIMKIPLDGGPPVTLATGQVNPGFIVTDGTWVYWANLATNSTNIGNVMKVPVDGGAAVIIAAAQETPAGVAVDSDWIYWTTGAWDGKNMSIRKARLDGGDLYVYSGTSYPAVSIDLDPTSNAMFVTAGACPGCDAGAIVKISPR